MWWYGARSQEARKWGQYVTTAAAIVASSVIISGLVMSWARRASARRERREHLAQPTAAPAKRLKRWVSAFDRALAVIGVTAMPPPPPAPTPATAAGAGSRVACADLSAAPPAPPAATPPARRRRRRAARPQMTADSLDQR